MTALPIVTWPDTAPVMRSLWRDYEVDEELYEGLQELAQLQGEQVSVTLQRLLREALQEEKKTDDHFDRSKQRSFESS